jgi:hypothetical protein
MCLRFFSLLFEIPRRAASQSLDDESRIARIECLYQKWQSTNADQKISALELWKWVVQLYASR